MISEIHREFERVCDRIGKGPIYPAVTPGEIREHLAARYTFEGRVELEELVGDVEHMLQTWQVQVTHPLYFGLFNPSVTLPSVIADTLTAMYNPQLASWRTSPAANEIERFTLTWLTGKFGLPDDSIASFTTGGAEANLSAVLAALTRAFPHYGDEGLSSLSAQPVIYLTAEAHHSFSKIAHMTGLGRHALRIVATDSQWKMDVAALERQVAEDGSAGLSPLMVIGTCGTTTAGIIDPLPAIGAFCKARGLWFHVDAAWGGAAILSPALRPHLAGIEGADSITCDAHKWFSVPMGCGMFFCRHADSIAQAFRVSTSYMPGRPADSAFDPYTNSVQWSRRFIGLKLFMSLAHYGERGYAAMIERQSRLGELLRKSLTASGWQVINQSPLPVVCFTRAGLDPGQFLNGLRDRQVAWMSEGRLGGTPVLRACITSFHTTEQDVLGVVDQLNLLVPCGDASFVSPAAS